MRLKDIRFFLYSFISAFLFWVNTCQVQAESPTPTITASIASDVQSVCKNGFKPIITFTGANGSGAYTFSYTINGVAQPDIATTSGASITINAPTNESGIYTYALTKVADSTHAYKLISDQSTVITVHETPTIAGVTQICGISSNSLLVGTGTSATSLAWQSSDPTIATIDNNGLVTSVAIGSATITYTDNNTCTTTTHIDIHHKPSVDITVPSGIQCAGSPISFQSTVTEDGSDPYTYSYLWNFDDVHETTAQISTDHYDPNPSHFFNFSGINDHTQTYNISLDVKNKQTGCTTQSLNKGLTLTPSPDATITLDATSNGTSYLNNGITVFKICAGTPSTFKFKNSSTTKNSINASYTIDWGDNTPTVSTSRWGDGDEFLPHTYAVGLWTLKYHISSNVPGGCDITRTYSVFVGSNPSVALVNPGNTSICKGEKVTFPISNTEHNPLGTSYIFTFGDGTDTTFAHPAPSSISHTYTKSSCGATTPDGVPNSFYVSLKASNPCTITPSSTAIQVSTPPTAKIALQGPSGCINQAFRISSAIDDAAEANGDDCNKNPKLVWKISPSDGVTLSAGSLGNDNASDDVNEWVSGTEQIFPIFSKRGKYHITLRAGNRCNTSIKDTTICIEPALSIPTFAVDKTEGCTPLTVNANNTTNVTDLCNAPTYYWKVNYNAEFGGTSQKYSCDDPYSSNPTFTFTNPGTYNLTLFVYTACGGMFSETTPIVVKQTPSVTIDPIPDICNNSSITPTINLIEGTPDTGSLTYNWTYSDRIANFSPDPGALTYSTPGAYSISLAVTNECGTSNTDTQNFTVKPVPQITTPSSDLSQTICSNMGSNEVTLTSDLPGTTYVWDTPSNSGVTGYETSGTGDVIPAALIQNTTDHAVSIDYSISPSLDGCTGNTAHSIITVNPEPHIDAQPLSGATCIGGAPDPISFSISNYEGTPSYQWYLADNAGSTPITNATDATYTPPATTTGEYYYYCKISFPGGCELYTDVATVSIYNPLTITAQPLSEQKICIGGRPTLSVSSIGGDGTPTYQWYFSPTASVSDGVAIINAVNSNYTPFATTTGTTYYYCKVETTGKDCHSATSEIASVTVFDKPVMTIQPEPTQTLCQNSIAINLEAAATGGIEGSYHYQWYNISSGIISGATNSIYTPSTNSAGSTSYFCRITQDHSGCEAISNMGDVNVNPGPTFTEQPQSTSYCLNEPSATPLSVHYINGAGTPTYEWYSTPNLSITATKIDGANFSTYIPSTSSVGDTYYYCKIKLSISDCGEIISEPARITIKPRPIISSSKTALICSETSFNITPSDVLPDQIPSGTNYIWSNPTVAPSGSISGASAQSMPVPSISQTLTNTTESPSTVTYTVTPISDGCAGANFNAIVTVNPAIKVFATITHSTCYGADNGSIQCTISGGVPFTAEPHQNISWVGPENFTANTANISNLRPGEYTLTVSDAGGFPFTHTYLIKQPDEITISVDSKKNISCNGYNNGAINLSVTGGTLPYAFTWTKDGQSYATTKNISSLSPGIYVVSVSDANHCGPKTMSYTITEPAVLTATVAQKTDILCYGAATGAITINVTGGTPAEISSGVFDYQYSWTGTNGYSSTIQNISALKAGSYTLNVSDQNGCQASLSSTLTQNSDIVITTTSSPVTCYGSDNATISLNISGGTAPYQTQWSNLATGTYQNNLSPGNYTIYVTDANQCKKNTSIVISAPPVFGIDPVIKNVTCNSMNDGSIKLNIKGNPISVQWEDGSTAGSERNNLTPGSYTVSISDGTPCIIHKTFIITEPQPLTVAEQVTDALDCNNANSGSIALTVSGGTTPYAYSWSNNATTKDIEKVQAGNYHVTITDANACTLTSQFKISRPDPMKISLSSAYNYDCSEQHLYQAFSVTATGGLPPYTYVWSNGTTSASSASTRTDQSGLISVTVNDSRGCYTSSSATSSIPELGIVYKLLDCNARSYQFEPLLVNEATENYSYLWDFGDGTTATSKTAQHQFSSAGIHTVRLRLTGMSCTTTYTKTIDVEPAPTITIAPAPKFCKGDSITVFASGANTYKWNNGTTSDHLLIKQDGDYSVMGVTAAGCSQTFTFTASYYPTHEYPIFSNKTSISFKAPSVDFWSDDNPALYYLWNFGDNTTAEGLKQTHTYNIDKGGYYDVTLSATNLYGCKSVVHKFILITNDTELNTFTPNGDGYNDIFLKGWHVKIFNRNGIQIFEGTNGWDGSYHGKTVSPDTYFYIVYYMTESGTKTKEGYVTLVK